MTDSDADDLATPHRPGGDWRCRDCHGEWPCPVFRRRMRLLYRDDPERLATFMRHFRDRAAHALPDLTASQLEARFVGWTTPPPRRRLRSI